MCTNPISVPERVCGRIVGYKTFSCGKCHECLSLKTNDYIQKYFREAIFRKSMHFVTLTYSDEYIPLNYFYVDNHGDYQYCSDAPYPEEESLIRDHWIDSYNFSGVETFVQDYDAVAFSTLRRRDVRLWIKRFRTETKLDFSFSFIGEYGKKGRPHYHGVIFGLDDKQVCSLLRTWKFGFTDFKKIPLISDKDDIFFVSRYVAKYMHKGSFEDYRISEGLAERPRVHSSINLGFGSSVDQSKLEDWYLAKDRFPDVSIHDSSFSEEYLDVVEARLAVFSLGGSRQQPLSKALKQRFLTYKYENPFTKKTYRKSSNLALALASRVQSRTIGGLEDQRKTLQRIQQMQGLSSSERVAKIQSYLDSLRYVSEDRENNSRKIYAQSLSKSKL